MAEAICREIIRRRRRKKGKRAGDDGKGKERKTGANCAHILNRCHLYWNTQRGVWSRENHQERRRTQNLSVDESLVQLNQQSVTLP